MDNNRVGRHKKWNLSMQNDMATELKISLSEALPMILAPCMTVELKQNMLLQRVQ